MPAKTHLRNCCSICGKGHTGRCDPTRLKHIEAGYRGAANRMERFGTLERTRVNYGAQLFDGFAMMSEWMYAD